MKEFLAECDENYNQRVSLAADKILSNLERSPIVLLSGPSGSGKTTTAMKIAEELAKKDDCLGLITGESIGQVASQTVHSLAVTNAVCTLPVFRPLIGFDKQDIVDISLKIGTYETSIEPYEDCCTIFVAKHPVTNRSCT